MPDAVPSSLYAPEAAARRSSRQNWVLGPFQDQLFIIGAPLLTLLAALALMARYGAEQGAALVIAGHVILTVAHHMPTFIRIYGDTDLFRRFKWSFLMAPVVPLGFATAMLVYINVKGYPVEYILYLYVFLALWDPWHFLRQHFGFMRIYDRGNAAPVRLASRMDWWVSATLFVYIMVASAEWIPELLEDLARNVHIPLALALPPGALQVATGITGAAALAMSAAYTGYLVWCMRRGYFVSAAKVALLLCTFAVMYLTYTPNPLILQLAPAWGFKVGFATLGIVHMTQYLAIVWRYDRRLAQQQRARTGVFHWLHSRPTRIGAVVAGLAYVAFCIGYGDAITTRPASRWLLSAVMAIGFTSTLLHYYFDGFIWKVRHQQNRAALDLGPMQAGSAQGGGAADANAPSAGTSWWSAARALTPHGMLVRQLLYFGLPLGILTAGALHAWGSDNSSYTQHMMAAQQHANAGESRQAADEARAAQKRMADSLPLVERMASLQPTSAREAELAFLIYNKALYDEQVLPALAGEAPDRAHMTRLRAAVVEAVRLLDSALASGGSLAHPGRDQLTREQAESVLASWRRRLG